MRGDVTRALLVTAALGLGIGGMPVPGGAVAMQETAPPELSSPVKTADEIAAIREAQAVTDRVYAGTWPLVRAGGRESEVKAKIVRRIEAAGAEVGFPPIVASGPHGALPHGSDEDRVMQDGEVVVIDMGAKVRGYHTDMTRTVPIGTPTEEMRQALRAVKAAQEAVLKAVQPGVGSVSWTPWPARFWPSEGRSGRIATRWGTGWGSPSPRTRASVPAAWLCCKQAW